MLYVNKGEVYVNKGMKKPLFLGVNHVPEVGLEPTADPLILGVFG
jgi:hypothetical protein